MTQHVSPVSFPDKMRVFGREEIFTPVTISGFLRSEEESLRKHDCQATASRIYKSTSTDLYRLNH